MKAFRRFNTLTLVLVAALVLGQAPALLASPAARIEGRIFATDMTTPAAGLDVNVTAEGAKAPVATTRTDKDGKFRLDGVEAGKYLLVLVDGSGKPVAAAPVTAAPGQRANLTLALPAVKAAPAQASKGGWFTTTFGAVTTVVASAVILALAADSVVDNDEDPEPVSPSSPN